MEITVPSKTFLIGEYGALVGGPALLVNTEPRFILQVNPKSKLSHAINDKSLFFAEASPAGQLFKLYHKHFENFDLQFLDPHQGRGGLGASSAQFAALYALLKKTLGSEEAFLSLKTKESLEILLQCYRDMSRSNRGLPPSGYDVIAQVLGGISLIDTRKNLFEVKDWILKDLSFILIRTGSKVATHSHLTQLEKNDFSSLAKLSEKTINYFLSGSPLEFLENIKLYRLALLEFGLTSEITQQMLLALDKYPQVIASKGCGALGADIIVLFCLKSEKEELIRNLHSKFEIVADETCLTGGLELDHLGKLEISQNKSSQFFKERSREV